MEENKCPNCGAPLGADFNKDITKCPYCSSVFVNKDKKDEESKPEEVIKPILNLDFDRVPKPKAELPKPKVKFNFLLFVILLFACWPIAIFYAIIAK